MTPLKSHWNPQDLERFSKFERKTVQHIDCIVWQNQIEPEQSIEIIDALAITWNDASVFVLAANSDGTGMTTYADINQHVSGLESPDPRIRLFRARADATQLWKEIVGQTLLKIGLTPDTEQSGQYINDGIVLQFETESREIKLHPLDGLILDYYES